MEGRSNYTIKRTQGDDMKRQKMTPVQRAIHMKRCMISRMESEQRRIRYAADDRIAKIQKRIDVAKVIIEAMEKGTLKP